MSASDWVREGELQARYWMQPTGSKRDAEIVREIAQPNRNLILSDVAAKRREAEQGNVRKLSFGRYLGSIPTIDFLRLQKSHPDLFSPDQELARKALVKFWNSPEAALFRVQRA